MFKHLFIFCLNTECLKTKTIARTVVLARNVVFFFVGMSFKCTLFDMVSTVKILNKKIISSLKFCEQWTELPKHFHVKNFQIIIYLFYFWCFLFICIIHRYIGTQFKFKGKNTWKTVLNFSKELVYEFSTMLYLRWRKY